MSPVLDRRSVLAALASFAWAGPSLANAPAASLRPVARGGNPPRSAVVDLADLVADAGLRGDVSFAVADTATGALRESYNPRTALPPASVAKALTALYALEALGPDHRFVTQVAGSGSLRNGVLSGDLYLVGGGDPTLATDDLNRLARGLKAAGVREVRGEFLVHEGALPYVRTIDRDQPEHVGYSPAVSGIALNYNRVHFQWQRSGGGYSIDMDARSDSLRPAVQSAVMQIADRGSPTYTYADRNGVDSWTVARGALGGAGSRWLPVRNPAAYAGDVFRTLARAQGIALGPARPVRRAAGGLQLLARHDSAPLSVILRDMLKWSTNLTAEMVGMAATAARGQAPSDLAASGRAMSAWAAARYGMGETALEDHSGLGDGSRMTSSDMVRALVQVNQRGVLRPLLKPYAMRDAAGRPVKSHPVQIDAKTGTLNFVSGLGGFLTTPDGTELAFAIFTADMATRRGLSKAERERPPGGKAWNARSRGLQHRLLERWGSLYGS
jgi:D-alanyl-D-alanine carboxypeptidase/D-alanyl-D-alanine-endopeptidase (penicillin-binding protein 4)